MKRSAQMLSEAVAEFIKDHDNDGGECWRPS